MERFAASDATIQPPRYHTSEPCIAALKTYRGRVSALSGQEQLELGKASSNALPLIDKASA